MGYIYKIENTVNKMVYIGQTNNIKRRWNEEKAGQVNNHLKRAFNKYGIDSFDFSILEECAQNQLDKKEIFYIKKYNSSNKKNGYNMTLGGNGFAPWSDERKKKQSLRVSGKNNPFYGKKHSEKTIKALQNRKGVLHPGYGTKRTIETRLLMSSIAKGANNPRAKSVYKYKKTGEFICSYGAVSEASIKSGIGYSAIKNCALKMTKSSGGFLWSYTVPQNFNIKEYMEERTKS